MTEAGAEGRSRSRGMRVPRQAGKGSAPGPEPQEGTHTARGPHLTSSRVRERTCYFQPRAGGSWRELVTAATGDSYTGGTSGWQQA